MLYCARCLACKKGSINSRIGTAGLCVCKVHHLEPAPSSFSSRKGVSWRWAPLGSNLPWARVQMDPASLTQPTHPVLHGWKSRQWGPLPCHVHSSFSLPTAFVPGLHISLAPDPFFPNSLGGCSGGRVRTVQGLPSSKWSAHLCAGFWALVSRRNAPLSSCLGRHYKAHHVGLYRLWKPLNPQQLLLKLAVLKLFPPIHLG